MTMRLNAIIFCGILIWNLPVDFVSGQFRSQPVQQPTIQHENQEMRPPFRLARSHLQTMPYRSARSPSDNSWKVAPNQPVFNHEFNNDPTAWYPKETVPTSHRDDFQGYFATALYQGGIDQEGPYPFVNGNIFGICREECCDEWAGHCPCLELTNWRSNCECTNPRRAHWGRARGGAQFRSSPISDSDCPSCNRTARQTVSEYFHPTR